ncbi:SPOR domain-containing protein [Humidesulfovibrio idahonensis]
MKGPRHLAPKIALALTASLLLPACAARKPIPSDPPEVRTEAMVRGKGHPAGPKPVEQPAPAAAQPALQGPVVETIVAEKKDPQTTDAQIKTAVAKVDARMSEVTADAQVAAKPEPAVAAPAAETKQTEAPAAKAADTDAKPAELKQADAKQPDAKQPVAKQESATQEGAEGKKAETAPKTEAAQAKDATQAARIYMVQIASFSTEKNADAALTWLKDKGYSEARVARAEQAQTVYHRVQAGPFQDLAAARKALEELKADWPQAFIPAD